MGSGPLVRKKEGALSAQKQQQQGRGAATSGQAGSAAGGGPDYSRRVVTGLPLRQPQPQPSVSTAHATPSGKMAGKEDVFQETSNIFVVLGASVRA